MKKKLLLIMVSILTIFSAFALSFNTKANAAEKTDQEMVQEELDNIVLPEEVIFDFPVVYVSVYGSTIKWESDKPEVINVPVNGGWAKVNRQAQDELVTLTVTLTKGSYSKSKDFEITVPKGQTLTNEYKLEYELNDGVLPEGAPTKYTVGSNLELPTPTKAGHKFVGWYDNANFEGVALENIPTGTFGDVKYYAKWEEAEISGIKVVEYKKEYNAKESFDKDSLVVVTIYEDETIPGLEIATDELKVNKTELHYGDVEVVVSYGNYEDKVEVVVNQLEYELDIKLEESYETTYNGKEQKIDLSNIELPKGLEFVISSYKDANESGYEVVVSLKNTDTDYKDVTTTYTTKYIIKKAALTVSFVCNDTFKAGQEIELSKYVSYSDFVPGESESVLEGTLAFDITPDGYPAAGTYTVTPKGLESDNYEIEYVSGTLELTVSSYEFKTEKTSVIYNGEIQMFEAKVLGDGQELEIDFTYTLKGTTESFTGAKDANTYIVIVSYELEGETKEHEVTFTIGAKQLEASMFNSIPEQNYTGQEVKPVPTSKTLVLDKDFEILGYDNNTDKTTEQSLARVTVKGLGNFTGEVDLYFAIGETALEEVREAKEELDKAYENVTEVPEQVLTETTNGSKVTWFSTSTALSFDKDGNATTILTDKEQIVVVYALITNGDSADYAMYEFTLPAKQEEKYNITLEFETLHGEVTVSKQSEITKGEEVTLKVTPKENYRVVSITVDGATYDATKLTHTLTINQNTTIKVVFEQYIYEDKDTGIVTEGESSKLIVTVEEKEEYTVSANQQTLAAYDINFEGHDGQTEVTVKIPVPQGYENEELVVYHLVNGEYVDMEAEKVDGYLVFTTSSFSPYVVTTKPIEGGEEPEQSSKVIIAAVRTEGSNYFIMTSDLGTSSTKRYQAVDSGTANKDLITTDQENALWELEASGNGYYLKSGDQYVTWTSGNSGTLGTKDAAVLLTKTQNSDGTYSLHFTASDGERYISLNATSGNNYFAFYKGTQKQNLVIIPVNSEGGEVTPDPEEPTPTTYKVTLETSGQGVASLSKQEGILANEKVTLTVTPSEGYKAVVKVDGVETTETVFTITKDITISVVFEEEQTENTDPTPDTELSIEQALALGTSKEHDKYTSGKYYVEGVITEVYNTQYGNMKIKDANGNILTVYGTYSADGETRYDALEVKPVAGDTVKVYGIIGQYNGTPQMKNGWIVEHTPAQGGEVTPDPDPTPDPEEPTSSTATLTFDNTSKRTILTDEQQVWVENGITVTGDKASSTTKVADYSNPARFYKGSNITIEYTSAISKIVITCSGDYYIKDGQAVSAGTLTVNGTVCTIVFDTPVTSVTLTSMGQQTRISSIEVTYVSSEGGEVTPDPEEPTPTTYKVTLETSGQGEASLSKQEGILANEKVTLTVTPSEGYKAVVKVDGVETTETIFTITKNITISVVFEEEQTEEPGTTPEEQSNKVIIAAVRTEGSNYFIMTSDLGTSSTKRYQAVDSGTANKDLITTDQENALWELEASGNGYYLKSGDQYVTWTSGNSGTLGTKDAAVLLTKTQNSDGTYSLHFTASDAERYIALNATSGNNYFAFYKSGQKQNLVIIPVNSEGNNTTN